MIVRDADGKPVGVKGATGPVGISDAETYDDDEAKRRFEAALRAALNTPHTPLKDKPKVRPKKAAEPGQAAVPSSGGVPSASSAPRGGRGRP